jgi:hypothetical protein
LVVIGRILGSRVQRFKGSKVHQVQGFKGSSGSGVQGFKGSSGSGVQRFIGFRVQGFILSLKGVESAT